MPIEFGKLPIQELRKKTKSLTFFYSKKRRRKRNLQEIQLRMDDEKYLVNKNKTKVRNKKNKIYIYIEKNIKD
jgi:hypothetical protein